MVGIDGTAQGRMNKTDSHLIQALRLHDEEAGYRNSATTILKLMPISQMKISVLMGGAYEDRIVVERDVA